jgi:16S rRNA G966 N2-methylase RsmD
VSTVADDVFSMIPQPRSLDADILALYDRPFPATRQGPLFNAFSYPTKISPEGIALFIATHTQPGDTVLDVFSGSGATGIAAKLCDAPTPAMLARATELNLTPTWGPRSAVLYDISVVGSLVADVMCNPPNPEAFELAARELVAGMRVTHDSLYEAAAPSGEPGIIRHVIWSDILECPGCGHEISYWDAAVSRAPVALADTFRCPACRGHHNVDSAARATETIYDDLIEQELTRRRRVPAWVYGRTGSQRWSREANNADRALATRCAEGPVPRSAPVQPLYWGDLYRAGYHTGISHLHHFYTGRNFRVLAHLWNAIEGFDASLQPALRMLVLSFNASHSTLMTRVVVKHGQSDFVLTGAQSGILYVSALPVEKNVLDGVERKIRTLKDAFALVDASKSSVRVVNGSSTDLDIPDGSVDYVFTDPPFGDFIPYSEINQINELWLGTTTDREAEAVISTAGGKDVQAYGVLLATIFARVGRVLADDGLVTVVFHSAKAAVWQALTSALKDADLTIRTTGLLDKTQITFKQVVSSTVVRGDALILLDKSKTRPNDRLSTVDELVSAVVADASDSDAPGEKTRERLFSRFVTRCLIEGVPVPLDVGEFDRLLDAAPLAP